jgi:hypothetical protein
MFSPLYVQRDAYYGDDVDDEASTYLPGPVVREFVEVFEPNVVSSDDGGGEDDVEGERDDEEERKKRRRQQCDDEDDVDEFENIELRDGVPEVSGKVTVTTRRRTVACA